jgi:hypothetical protein
MIWESIGNDRRGPTILHLVLPGVMRNVQEAFTAVYCIHIVIIIFRKMLVLHGALLVANLQLVWQCIFDIMSYYGFQDVQCKEPKRGHFLKYQIEL